MKLIMRNLKYIILLKVLIITAFNTAFAANIHDVYNGISVETELRSKNVIPKVKYFRMEVELLYFQITKPQLAGDKLINESIEAFCTEYLQNDAKSLAILAEWQLRARVIEELRNSASYGDDDGQIYLPQLTDIECDVVSLLNGILTFRLEFQFESDEEQEEMSISYYFTANRANGKITPFVNQLNDNELRIIQNRLSLRINEEYKFVTSKISQEDLELLKRYEDSYDDDDDDEYGDDDIANKKEDCWDICTKIDFSEAQFYWYAWGVVVEFQKFTKSSKIFYGNYYSYFLPYEEAVKVFSGLTGFDFLGQIRPSSTRIKNLNPNEFMRLLNDSRQKPNPENILANSPLSKSYKQLKINRFQVMTNGEKRFMGKSVMEFNQDGKLLKKVNYQEDNRVYNTYIYTYNIVGNLSGESEVGYDSEKNSVVYEYDSRNNLSEEKRFGNDEMSETYYYYTGNSCYQMNVNVFQEIDNEQINKYTMDDNAFCANDICFMLDDERRVIGIKSSKYTMYNGQIGYNERGQVVEYHTDNERYHYFWDYDGAGKLVKWYGMDGNTISQEVLLDYKNGGNLPSSSTNNQFSYGSKTEIYEEYEWE